MLQCHAFSLLFANYKPFIMIIGQSRDVRMNPDAPPFLTIGGREAPGFLLFHEKYFCEPIAR
jgi:hypothetical protein